MVTIGSYINRDSNEANGCAPAGNSTTTGGQLYTGVKTPGACNNKIMLSVSNNAGASFTGSTVDPRLLPVVNTARQATTDQWWQWTEFTPGGTLAISYYDRSYGIDQLSGYMDITVSTSHDQATFAVSGSPPLPCRCPRSSPGNSWVTTRA